MLKKIILFSFIFIFFGGISLLAQPIDIEDEPPELPTQSPTYANIAGPEHVLVVYLHPNANDSLGTISEEIKDYYQNARGISEDNIVSVTT